MANDGIRVAAQRGTISCLAVVIPAAAGKLGALVAVATLAAPSVACAALPDRIYTFRELLDRSDLILVADVVVPEGSKKGAPQKTGLLRVRKVLKGDVPQDSICFRVEGPPLPAGAKAIWFLTTPGPDGVFVIDHPQCAYDTTHRALVEIGTRTRERIRRGYYLRREDERLAERIRRAKEKRALAGVRPGPTPEGLALAFEVADRKSRAGEPVLARFTLTNGGPKTLLVCDSAQECWFVVAEPEATGDTPGERLATEDTEVTEGNGSPARRSPRRSDSVLSVTSVAKSVVAKAGAPEIRGQSALGIGLLISEHDFTRLAPGKSVRRSLTVSPEVVGLLREPGKVSIRGVYHYRRPPAPLVDLPRRAWEGSVASDPVEIEVLPRLGR